MGRLNHYSKERIVKLKEEGYKPSQILRILESEEIQLSRVGLWKFLQRFKQNTKTSNKIYLYKLDVDINGETVTMEIDTGSSVTLLNSKDFQKVGGRTEFLQPATVLLKSYTANAIKCFGESKMEVKVGDQVSNLNIRVVEGPSLIVRDMMTKFRLP